MHTILLAAALAAAAQPTQPPHGISTSKGVPITASSFNGTWYGPATPPANAVNWITITSSGSQYSATTYAFCSRPTKAFCKVAIGSLTTGSGPAQGHYQNGFTVIKYQVFPLADGSLQFIASTTTMSGQNQTTSEVLYKTKPSLKPPGKHRG